IPRGNGFASDPLDGWATGAAREPPLERTARRRPTYRAPRSGPGTERLFGADMPGAAVPFYLRWAVVCGAIFGGPMRVGPLLAFTALMLLPAREGAASPNCWQLAGGEQSCYELDHDFVVTHAGKPSGRLMSVGECQSFGTMVQCIDPTDYAG